MPFVIYPHACPLFGLTGSLLPRTSVNLLRCDSCNEMDTKQDWLQYSHRERMTMVQVVDVVVDETGRLSWLSEHLPAFIDNGDVLIFASQKAKVDELTGRLKAQGCRYMTLPFHCRRHDDWALARLISSQLSLMSRSALNLSVLDMSDGF